MTFHLTDEEWEMLSRVPVEDVIELAADLDVIIPERVDRRTLLETCVPLIIARGQRTGLPFSKYDLDDLKELGSEQLTALGRIQGLRGRVTVAAVLKVGQRTYKTLQKGRLGTDPFAYMIPILLGPTLRFAIERGLHR